MTRHGSFYPLRRDVASAEGDVRLCPRPARPARSLEEEILERLSAIQALSQKMATAKLESSDPSSHGGLLDALAILSR